MPSFLLRSSRQARLAYIITDIIICAFSFYLSYISKFNSLAVISYKIELPFLREYSFIFILWVIFIIIFFNKSGLYFTNRGLSIPKEIYSACVNIIYTAVLIGAVIFFAKYKFFSRQVFLVNFVLSCLLLSGWRTGKRIILRRMILSGFNNINVLIVGAGKIGRIVQDEIKRNPWLGLRVVGFLDDSLSGDKVLAGLKDFFATAKKYFVDEVIITIPSERHAVSRLIKESKTLRLGVSIVPESFDEPLPSVNLGYLGAIPLINYKERRHHPAEIAIKHFFDFTICLAAFLVLSPVFAVIAILIKLDSAGPVFYVQKRVGAKGKVFDFYKFRSMVKDADSLKAGLLGKNEVKDGIIFKIRNDPRITPVGTFLRRNSLDELPQLINVIKGDMGLVGPRPPTPDEVEKYHYTHMQRLSIKPGITGLSQVKGRSELTFRKWVKWDAWYLDNWSFALDLAILWWTLPAVLKKKGAY